MAKKLPFTELTPRLKEYLVWIRRFVRRHEWAPTVREVAEGMGVERNAAYEAIRRLEAGRYLARGGGARSMRVLPKGWKGC